MPNVMVALPNIGGALCSTPQSLADAHYYMPCSNAAKTRKPLKVAGVPQTGALKSRELTMREWTSRHEETGVDNAGVDNAGVAKHEQRGGMSRNNMSHIR